MPQTARVIMPHYPHHVIQRGNRNQKVFFSDNDRQIYLNILKAESLKAGVEIWAWCLMDNHVHFVAVPKEEESLGRCFGETHKRYTKYINEREGWKGFLWQGRFRSFPMDESYLCSAVRYVERNPVEAQLVSKPEEYPWSSARARILGSYDPILSRCSLDNEIKNWPDFLEGPIQEKLTIDAHVSTGKPLGKTDFIRLLEHKTNRIFIKKIGRPIKK